MTTVPQECQAQADLVANLRNRYNELAEQVNNVTGTAVWPLLAQLADVNTQLISAQSELQICISNVAAGFTGTWDGTSGPAVTGEIVVIDASTSVVMGQQAASLWELADSGLVEREKCVITSTGLAFNTPLPAISAVTVTSEEGGTDPVVFFRSGTQQLVSPLRLEAVLTPEIRIAAADLDRWLTSLLPIEVPLRAEAVDSLVTVTALSSALEPGVVGVALRGSLRGTAWGVSLAGTEISGTLRCSIAPATGADARYALTASTAGGGSTLQLSGSFVAMVANLFLSVATPLMEGTILDQVRGWLDTAVTAVACKSLLLPELPPGTTLTIRYCQVDAAGLTLEPALGAVGTSLTTYDLPPILAV